VLLAVALLTSRRIPTSLGFVVDRRDRHQLRQAADLAEALGCVSLNFALAQPVPGSAARDSDLAPHEWYAARDEILALAREPQRRTAVYLDYGAPFEGPEPACDTFAQRRLYVDARGRLSLCCQLSEYGDNENDVVADLTTTSFTEAWPRYTARLDELGRANAALASRGNAFDPFPCLRCARALGKMAWLADYPASPWHGAAGPATLAPARPLVTLGPLRPRLQTA
jgi:MoaA/NifB/PqqE/SkfB family radical SAM enzyme